MSLFSAFDSVYPSPYLLVDDKSSSLNQTGSHRAVQPRLSTGLEIFLLLFISLVKRELHIQKHEMFNLFMVVNTCTLSNASRVWFNKITQIQVCQWIKINTQIVPHTRLEAPLVPYKKNCYPHLVRF